MPASPQTATRRQIDELRQQHIGRLLLRAQRAYDARALEKLHARGYTDLTLAHMTLLAHLDTDGTRITMLAHRVGVTKQAIGQIVQELERKGYIARASDPSDARATLVRFTDKGWRFLRDAYELKREIEAEYAAILGDAGFASLQSALMTLLEGVASPTNTNDHEEQQ